MTAAKRTSSFSLTDVIADNSCSSALAVGAWVDPSVDSSNLGLIMEIDGEARQIGSTAAIPGNPVFSLVAAARLTAERGDGLQAGDIVMAGGATAAEAVAVGNYVKLSVERLGTVAFSMKA